MGMSPRTIIFAIGMTALAAFFGVMGLGTFVARAWDELLDGGTMCAIAAILVWGVVIMVRGDAEDDQRGFDVGRDSEEE